jgi:ectoine hydroxylase-related dioxygenase (phytanoyl-CoA dioxygenase family)
MKGNYYGNIKQVECNDELDLYIEEIQNLGYTIIENILTQDELEIYRKKIDEIYRIQEEQFGVDNLNLIKEKKICVGCQLNMTIIL